MLVTVFSHITIPRSLPEVLMLLEVCVFVITEKLLLGLDPHAVTVRTTLPPAAERVCVACVYVRFAPIVAFTIALSVLSHIRIV